MMKRTDIKRFLMGAAAAVIAIAYLAPAAQAAYSQGFTLGAFTGDLTTPGNGSYVTTITKFNGGTPFGSMAGQSASGVAITGGAVSGASVAATTLSASGASALSAVTATTVAATGNVSGAAGVFAGPLTSTGQIAAVLSVTASGAVTLTSANYFVCVNKATGSATALTGDASPVVGEIHVIKDCKGDAATNNITFTPTSGTIDGGPSYVMTQAYQSANIIYTPSGWSIF